MPGIHEGINISVYYCGWSADDDDDCEYTLSHSLFLSSLRLAATARCGGDDVACPQHFVFGFMSHRAPAQGDTKAAFCQTCGLSAHIHLEFQQRGYGHRRNCIVVIAKSSFESLKFAISSSFHR